MSKTTADRPMTLNRIARIVKVIFTKDGTPEYWAMQFSLNYTFATILDQFYSVWKIYLIPSAFLALAGMAFLLFKSWQRKQIGWLLILLGVTLLLLLTLLKLISPDLFDA